MSGVVDAVDARSSHLFFSVCEPIFLRTDGGGCLLVPSLNDFRDYLPVRAENWQKGIAWLIRSRLPSFPIHLLRTFTFLLPIAFLITIQLLRPIDLFIDMGYSMPIAWVLCLGFPWFISCRFTFLSRLPHFLKCSQFTCWRQFHCCDQLPSCNQLL